jgi:hypothetical protein
MTTINESTQVKLVAMLESKIDAYATELQSGQPDLAGLTALRSEVSELRFALAYLEELQLRASRTLSPTAVAWLVADGVAQDTPDGGINGPFGGGSSDGKGSSGSWIIRRR